jgi:hypothetical protein
VLGSTLLLGVAVGVWLGVALVADGDMLEAVEAVAEACGWAEVVDPSGHSCQAATPPPPSRTKPATTGTRTLAALCFARRALTTISPE